VVSRGCTMDDAVQLIHIPELQPEYCVPYGPCNFQKEADSFDATMKAVSYEGSSDTPRYQFAEKKNNRGL
jgi:hypothetical protein